ncbi:MAG: hypothetical protein JNK76_08620 [Planctomycetales bacterium]|nr:hypothetical protein [Planctomycetales bacterium]
MAHLIAGLAEVDGAVVLSKRHELLVFSMARLREQAFPMTWADFAGFNVRKEKPLPIPATQHNIGAQDLLFCWVRSRWWPAPNPLMPPTGWLACNDGSREISDFIHFDSPGGQATLSLIHVKATKNSDPGRPVDTGGLKSQKAILAGPRTLCDLAIQAAISAARFLSRRANPTVDAEVQTRRSSDERD